MKSVLRTLIGELASIYDNIKYTSKYFLILKYNGNATI